MNGCHLCPRHCGTDRIPLSISSVPSTVNWEKESVRESTRHGLGACNATNIIKVARVGLHQYEEPLICFGAGSGTIFFTGCSLKCCFCQNQSVSRNLCGREISPRQLADEFKRLEDLGAVNINLVTPSQYLEGILKAFDLYHPKIPVLYNTGGYELPTTIERLKDVVDIYLPDMKYKDTFLSTRYSACADYFEYASVAIERMTEQKSLQFDENGHMTQGVIIRHLILPQATYDAIAVLDWIAEHIGKRAYVSLMAQYTPFGDLAHTPELNRPITAREYTRAKEHMEFLGLNGFVQARSSSDIKYIPNWDY